MKKLLMLAALSLPVMAQSERFHLHEFGVEFRDTQIYLFQGFFDVYYRVDRDVNDGTKTLHVFPNEFKFVLQGSSSGLPQFESVGLTQSQAYNVGIVQALLGAFRAEGYPGNPPKKIIFEYGALATTAPELVALDAKSDNRMVTINLSTFTAKYSATLADGVRNFGLRPSVSGPSAEAWVAHSNIGTLFTVVNLDSGAIVGKVPTTLTGEPRGVVFSNSGNTAFEILQNVDLRGPTDSGTLVVLDTATRAIKNTLPIPFGPGAILISPDGATVYVIAAGGGKILYYDLLSGTAALTVTLPTADTFFGPYLIHPNGSRIYGRFDGRILVFDPQVRKVVAKYNLGLAPFVNVTNMQLSPDGTKLFVLDDAERHGQPVNNIFVLDAVTGYSFGSRPIGGTASIFFVAPKVQ